MTSITIVGSVYKMNNDVWRVCIPNDVNDITYTVPYSGLLDKEEYTLLSSESDIDINYMDDDDYLYQVDSDHAFIYCFAYTENCARAGIIDFIKKHHSLQSLNDKKSIEYNLYKQVVGVYWTNDNV
jgi:ABC-type metal ion transport system substrate-binding protein